MPKPVIISAAITGSIHVPSMSPHLPITPAQIAAEALAAARNAEQVERLKSILHLLGFDVAIPAQARDRLALKGAAHTRF